MSLLENPSQETRTFLLKEAEKEAESDNVLDGDPKRFVHISGIQLGTKQSFTFRLSDNIDASQVEDTGRMLSSRTMSDAMLEVQAKLLKQTGQTFDSDENVSA